MRKDYLCVVMLTSALMACQPKKESSIPTAFNFQLAAPRIIIDSVLFRESAKVRIELDHPGVELFYSLENDEVSRNDEKYESTLTVNESSKIAVRAFHPDYQNSDVIAQGIIKVNDFSKKAIARLNQTPHPSYPGGGEQSLLDLRKGTTNFRQGGFWMGFQEESVDVGIEFNVNETIKSISLSALQDHGSWIFLPGKIQVLSENQILSEKTWPSPENQEPTRLQFLTIDFPNSTTTKKITIKIISEPIPDWHDGKGTVPWLFIDEVLIN